MKHLIFILIIGIMFSCNDIEIKDLIEYEFTGNGYEPARITYLDASGVEQTITIAETPIKNGWRWIYKYLVESEQNILISATIETVDTQDGSITVLRNSKIIASTNKYTPIEDEYNNIIGYRLNLGMSPEDFISVDDFSGLDWFEN